MLARFAPLLFGFGVLALSGAVAVTGCVDMVPEKITLYPEATDVEIVSDSPNMDVYEPAGQIRAQAIGRDNAATLREACNMLRNQAAARGATFVAIDDVSTHAAWDFTGRTIVTLIGTVYRPK